MMTLVGEASGRASTPVFSTIPFNSLDDRSVRHKVVLAPVPWKNAVFEERDDHPFDRKSFGARSRSWIFVVFANLIVAHCGSLSAARSSIANRLPDEES